MKIKIITLFPELIKGYLQEAIIAKAIGTGLLNIEIMNLRDFSDNPYRSVDDSPMGGGDGMLLRPDILEAALLSVKNEMSHVIYLSPQGELLKSQTAKKFSESDREIVLICGRYAGVDQRFIDKHVDQEISIGDYVLSGGELAALVFIEAASRFIPGVLGKIKSAEEDSFKDGLLEAPQYTRPQDWSGMKVPEVLASGNHKKIAEWKAEQALKVTEEKRPDLLRGKK